MKAHVHLKGKGASRVSNQKVAFELKHRVILAINKLADRDSYQVGVQELEKTIGCLTPDGVAPFLSCILDTDSEQKSTIRKECIRLIGILATFHEDYIGSHLGKIVASIVKRLKDPDSVVRDACVKTMGVLASKLSIGEGESDAVFVVLVKPLFEVLCEQNKQVQAGSALCLSRVIDNTNLPSVLILQQMLTKIMKLLKNPHFMAKPAVIELTRSIIQAGGAPTQSVLSAAMTSIQEALKNSDWTTRKAASAALGELASSGGLAYGPLKSSCISALESCRFDKVKPVRDTALQALSLWKILIGRDTSEPSETRSSIKGSGSGHGEISSASEAVLKDVKLTKIDRDSVTRKSPLSLKNVAKKKMEYSQHLKENDWQIETAVPKKLNAYLSDVHNEESECSSVSKTFERTSTDITSNQYIGYEYVPMDDKQECSSMSSLVTDNFDTKFVQKMGTSQQFEDEETSTGKQKKIVQRQDRESLGSTGAVSRSHTMGACYLQTADEIVIIRKHLFEIEDKQSDLLDLLKREVLSLDHYMQTFHSLMQGSQFINSEELSGSTYNVSHVFTTNTMESLSMIELKVSGLEDVVDKMAHHLVHGGRYSDLSTTDLLNKTSIVASPRLSTCTRRPSVDIRTRPPLLPKKSNEVWEEKTFVTSKLSTSTKQGVQVRTDSIVMESKTPVGKTTQRSSEQVALGSQNRKVATIAGYNCSEIRNSPWNIVKGHLSKGDLDSAYVEALDSGDELVLIELLDKTGPVLESLSHETANDVLSTLSSYFLEQRFMNSMIPWLQQVVELSSIHGPDHLLLSSKARREFLSAIQEAVNMEFSSSAERRSVMQLVMKLHQIWVDFEDQMIPFTEHREFNMWVALTPKESAQKIR